MWLNVYVTILQVGIFLSWKVIIIPSKVKFDRLLQGESMPTFLSRAMLEKQSLTLNLNWELFLQHLHTIMKFVTSLSEFLDLLANDDVDDVIKPDNQLDKLQL